MYKIINFHKLNELIQFNAEKGQLIFSGPMTTTTLQPLY